MTTRQQNSKKSLTYYAIFLAFTLFVLLYDAILILLSAFKKGIFKKEILSKKSQLGFDFKIIVK
tara:strand:+ start:403 stop:594 length:192 start_codon:yes stop_codon:yes gene_type:complete